MCKSASTSRSLLSLRMKLSGAKVEAEESGNVLYPPFPDF
jgi:hypothetical protein